MRTIKRLLKAETHDATNRLDTSPRQVAATNGLVHRRCDIILSLLRHNFVAAICQTNSNWFETPCALSRDYLRPRHTMRQIAATRRRDRLLQQIASCENHRRCDRIWSLRSVTRIQTGLNWCDISQRQTNSKRLVAAAVQTRWRVAATYRRDLSHHVSRPFRSMQKRKGTR